MKGRFRVLYLTGAPASGKSSVTKALSALVAPLEVFEYGEQLTRFLQDRRGGSLTQQRLRQESAGLAGPADIRAVDQQLLEFVAENRLRSNVVIDTHAVTKEQYGFRVTPYSLDHFALLSPDTICVLYTPPRVSVERIGRDSGGRPRVSEWEAGFHGGLQASVAVTYGMSLGLPVYLVDSSGPIERVAAEVAKRFGEPRDANDTGRERDQ
jgi:adenylate kinase